MCDCGTMTLPSFAQQRTSDNPCAAVTLSVLTVYKWAVHCVITGNHYQAVSVTYEEAHNAYAKLNEWYDLKIQNPEDCSFMNLLPVFQDIVKRIVNSGVCS